MVSSPSSFVFLVCTVRTGDHCTSAIIFAGLAMAMESVHDTSLSLFWIVLVALRWLQYRKLTKYGVQI